MSFVSIAIGFHSPLPMAVYTVTFTPSIMKRHVLIFGLVGGLLIATLQYTEYRFVIIEHSVELYSALVAILFATFGIWLGLRITRSRETIRETVVVKEVLVPAEAPALEPFAPNTAHQQTLGITARELEILTLIAGGFSAAFRFRKHRQDTLCPRLRQARSRPPHPGRPARQRTRPPAASEDGVTIRCNGAGCRHPFG